MSSKSLASAAIASGLALALPGCYVVPVQVEEGKPPVYAYVPAPSAAAAQVPARNAAPAAAPVVAPVAVTARQTGSIHVRLYPMNDAAAKLGPLQGIVTDNLSGRGTFSLHAQGEQMQGEASRVPEHFPGFGRLIADTLGDAPTNASGAQRGIANAYGTRGSYANCEYVLSSASAGTGACLFSNGARFQLHFGG